MARELWRIVSLLVCHPDLAERGEGPLYCNIRFLVSR